MLTLTLVLALAGTSPTMNDRCPVTGFEVRNHVLYHHVTVRGHEYYVYDRTAAIRLRNCPECYLHKDGTPKNDIKAPCPH
jgi:hypothetical protein